MKQIYDKFKSAAIEDGLLSDNDSKSSNSTQKVLIMALGIGNICLTA